MKKKLLIAVMAITSALSCAVCLAACGGSSSDGGHKHKYQWVDNGDGTHKQHCSVDGCDEPDKDSGSHVWGANNKCVCGATKSAEAHKHDYQWVDNGDGTHKQHCSVSGCNEPDIGSGSHVYGTDDKCECGAEIPDQLLTFELNEAGDAYTVTGKEKGSPTDIVIPYMHEGLPVTAIDTWAFSPYWQDPEAVALTSVTLPESVTEIGKYAFYQSTIKTINLSHVKTIGECAFRDSHLGGDLDLTEIETLGAGAFELDGIISDIGTDYVHENSLEFNNVKLGDKLKTIEIWTFYGRYINNLTLGNGLEEIKKGSFWYNDFSEVVIPDSVTTIAEWAFADCPNLHSVTYGANMSNESQLGFTHISTGPVVEICNRSQYVTAARPAGTAVFTTSEEDKGEIVTDSNNFRFYINKTLGVRVLLKSLNATVTSLPEAAPDGGTYEVGYYAFREKFKGTKLEVPEKVTRIRNGAFAISPSLTTVILGNGVTQIDDNAFSTCQNLLSVTVGANVKSIGNNAFNNCNRLIEVANLSTLDIQTKSSDNGRVGYYAKNVFDPRVEGSKLYTTDDGYMFYADVDNDIVYLVSYTGGKTYLVLPENFLGKAYGLYAYAFYGCDGMTSIVIPESITTIDENALCCVGLTIYCKGESAGENWGAKWNGWGNPVVWDCENNDTDEEGYVYAIIDGLRYALKDGEATVAEQPTTLSGEITIPVSVTYGDDDNGVTYTVTGIGEGAFYSCDNLTGIIIECEITELPEDTFGKGMTNITLPESLTLIDKWTLWGCDSLSEITFKGTKEQWNAIAEDNWDKYIAEDYVVHCTDGDITKS